MSNFGGPHSAHCLSTRGSSDCPAYPYGHVGFGLDGVAMANRARCVAEPLYLASEVMSNLWDTNLMRTPSAQHIAVAAAMVEQVNILYIDARSTAKTTLLDEVGGVHQLLAYCNDCLLFMQASEENAKALAGQVRNHFMFNEVLRKLFPEYAMTKGETGNILKFSVPCRQTHSREASVEIGTPGASMAGRHYDVIFGSDIMNENTTPPPCGKGTIELMRSLVAWYAQTDGLLKGKEINPRAHKRIDTNRWHDGDLGGEIIRRDKKNTFRKIIGGCKRAPDGTWIPSWPEVKTPQMIQDIHDAPTMTAATFAANYCSDPLPEGGVAFQRNWFHYFGSGRCECGALHETPPGMDVWITCDPAFTQEMTRATQRSDRSALVVTGVAPGSGHLFVLQTKAGRWSADDFVEELWKLICFWKPSWIGIEDTGSSRGLKSILLSRMARLGQFVRYRDLKPAGRSKEVRIIPLHAHAQHFGLYVRREHADLVEELLRYGVADDNDLADALAYRALEMYDMPGAIRSEPVARPTEVPPTHRTDGTDILKRLEARQTARENANKRWMRRTA